MSFAMFKLHPDLLKGVKELGFTRATPIQEQAIPPALEGRDLLACAMTGSGKTAAFLLPILHRLISKPRGTTRALILTPTRELAAQIDEHLRQLAVHTPLSGAAVFGGVGMGPQEHAFRSGADVIIATPGRLLDHFKQPYAKLSGLEVLVLDEADRMLDMGFLPDIKRVLKHLPPKRQTLFFSATMPGPIQALTRELLHNPATINLERKSAPAVGIRQALYPVREELKPALFVELMRRGDIGNVIVFTRTKHRANRLADYLVKEGIPNAGAAFRSRLIVAGLCSSSRVSAWIGPGIVAEKKSVWRLVGRCLRTRLMSGRKPMSSIRSASSSTSTSSPLSLAYGCLK